MTVATAGQAVTYLRSLDFVVATDTQLRFATAVFQSAWRLGTAEKGVLLDVDGIVGRKTTDALREADDRRRDGATTCSPHFSFREFACKCNGTQPGCIGNYVVGPLVDAAELLRTVGYSKGGLHPISGFRCPGRNTAVKKRVTSSLHQWGAALDIDPVLKTKEVKDLGVFTGIGYNRSGLVKHVDVRGLSTGRGKMLDAVRPVNPTASTRSKPAVFLDV